MVAPPAVPGDDFRMTKMSPSPRRALARMAANEGERDMRILVIEDDTKTGEYLKKGLGESGYAVDWSQHGADGLYLALENRYDLVVLDVMLPGLDGWQIMEVLRKKHDVPVLFLTARDQLQDRIRGLELGADDYLVKPFSFTELLLRIRTLLRRGVVREAEQVQLADLQLDVLRRKVSRQGQVIALTNKEFALLHLLMRREGEVLSRTLIASEVWDMNFDSDTNVVDVAIKRLRAKVDYLYRSVEEAMLRRSDVMVAGRVEHFRNLLRDNLTLAELKARPRLFENMLGNEQDILLLGQPGEAPIVAVNPRHERLPSLRVVAAGQALNPSVVHAALTHDGIPMRVLAAEVLVGGREPLQITAAHLLLGETRMLAQYRDRVIAAVLLAFLGTALLGWLVLRHGLRPLRTLAAKAAEIHPTSLDTRLDVAAAPAELQQVAQSFNAMLERLDDGYQRLQQFSADLAHEIRTPIGSLMGHGQVALRQPRSNEEYQALIASNQEELERIARMVESILFLARADDVRAAVERSRLDLGEELRRQAEYFEGLAEERGLSLDIQVSGQLRADPQLFRRALSNLLANAIRYASADSLIEVRGLRRSGEFLLSVENACDRLPAEPLSRLFDRFYRGDAARSDAQSSGLGLAIVQAIMRLHGGRAEASAPAPGRIRFDLAFPAQD